MANPEATSFPQSGDEPVGHRACGKVSSQLMAVMTGARLDMQAWVEYPAAGHQSALKVFWRNLTGFKRAESLTMKNKVR